MRPCLKAELLYMLDNIIDALHHSEEELEKFSIAVKHPFFVEKIKAEIDAFVDQKNGTREQVLITRCYAVIITCALN